MIKKYSKTVKKYTKTNKGHGRLETRTLQAMDCPEYLKEWPGVQQILKMTRTREIKGKGKGKKKKTTTVAYGITSLSKEKAPPEKIMELWKNHWNIENNLHWVRDMVFDEDKSTIRKGNSAEAMASLRNLCITLANKLNTSITDL
jgi:predicted transposase YbfD/YdcC